MQLEQIAKQVIEISKQAGDFIRSERKSFNSDKIEYKGLNDLVSYVDKGAEGLSYPDLKKYCLRPALLPKKKPLPK
jgi:myo-inositol-1(or 4)-monophosphatase